MKRVNFTAPIEESVTFRSYHEMYEAWEECPWLTPGDFHVASLIFDGVPAEIVYSPESGATK